MTVLSRNFEFDPSGLFAAAASMIEGVAPYFPLAIAGTIVWGLWIYRFILSRLARPIETVVLAKWKACVPSRCTRMCCNVACSASTISVTLFLK